jgi:hypothetical protein
LRPEPILCHASDRQGGESPGGDQDAINPQLEALPKFITNTEEESHGHEEKEGKKEEQVVH